MSEPPIDEYLEGILNYLLNRPLEDVSGPRWQMSDYFKRMIAKGKRPENLALCGLVNKISGASVQLRYSILDEKHEVLATIDLPFINQGCNVTLFKLEQSFQVNIA